MLEQFLFTHLASLGLTGTMLNMTALLLALISLLVFLSLTFYLSRHFLMPFLNRIIDQLDGETLAATTSERPTFASHIAHLIPAVLLIMLVNWFFEAWPLWEAWVYKLTWLYLYLFIGLSFASFINLITAIYNLKYPNSNLPYRVISQLIKLLTMIVVIILSLSLLIGSSPAYLLSGLGALTAVLLLVFRDTLLGLVASVQVAANRMVAKGDWIEMPKYGANGNVIEVALTTVKVRNWDNTITTFPTYALISDSFINWRAMQESGGRRIKRSILLDIHTIRFVDAEELTKFKNNRFLSRFFEEQSYVDLNQADLTNSALFRAYIEWTLRQNPLINQNLMVMARQLQPSEVGLPIEVYCFSADKAWVNYERIQSEIFDKLLAVLPLFDLMAFQRLGNKSNITNEL
jgi:miniconductance mechanosensitive channel